MNQNHLSDGFRGRRLRMDQDLYARLRVVEFRLHRETPFIQCAMPIVSRESEQVRIPKEWDKGPQALF